MGDYQASIITPFAHLGIRMVGDKLAAIDFIDSDGEIKPHDAGAQGVCNQIRRYLDSPAGGYSFSIAYQLAGTPFQQSVWNALATIPAGKVTRYGELAKKLGTSARAVGNACRMNPVPVVIPCHRVVAAHGIGGYAGDTGGELLDIKRWLLEHEGVLPHRLS
jgi:methylated-DNA-[protein]-cysteine S-methyltransferase